MILIACVQMPTEKQSSVDLRPQISFTVSNPALDPAGLEVRIDGLPVGMVSSYLAGQQAVRVRSGTHVVTVSRDGNVVLEERIYLGDTANKTLVIN
jgi:hypothetical protein